MINNVQITATRNIHDDATTKHVPTNHDEQPEPNTNDEPATDNESDDEGQCRALECSGAQMMSDFLPAEVAVN